MSIDFLHRRYSQQAAWTAPAQRRLLASAGLPNARRVLEVGCGTGAVLRNVTPPPGATLFGIDIDRPALMLAAENTPNAYLSTADAHKLPFETGSFDIAFCHFVLLWLADPAAALAETRRVVRPGGAVLAIAEPDYSQRVDEPSELVALGAAQRKALLARGANPDLGSQLATLFSDVGLRLEDAGQLETPVTMGQTEVELEQEVLHADLADFMVPADLDRLLDMDKHAWQAGTRVLQVPTYYALARVY